MSDIDQEQYDKAKALVRREEKCSPSWLQRELGTTYTVASALVTQMEEDGLVSTPAGNGRRSVITDAPGWGETDQDDQGGEVVAAGDGSGEALPDYIEGDDTEREGEGWDAEGEHTLAVDRMSAIADELVLTDDKRLVEDIRDFLLDVIKTRPKPWSGTSQAEKRDVAAACEHSASELVRKVVEAIAARGVDPVRVLLTKVAMGNDIVITGKVKAFDPHEEHKAISILHGALNKHVMLTVATKDDYSSGEESEESEEFDEPAFGFEAGEAEDDADPDPVADAAVDAALGEMAGEYDDDDDQDEEEAED